MAKSSATSEFSFISEIIIEEWLMRDLGISRSKIKEFHFKKKWLQKCTKHKENVSFLTDLLNINLINPVYSGPAINVLHQDEHLLTLSKPPGMHLFPLRYSETDTVLNFLRSQNFGRDILQVAPQTHEKGALFRIDRVTSGLMVFARNDLTYQEWQKQLNRQKHYLAIVQGNIHTKAHYRHFLSGLNKGGAKVECLANPSSESVEANIDIFPLAYRSDLNLSLIGVMLNEGHRHQIRVQLAKIDHPIFGDDLYGGASAERVFLHAWAYNVGLRIFRDDSCQLFGKFFDLNSGLQMFSNHCGVRE